MAIIALKAWYIENYEPVRELEKRPYDLRLSKNSLLKTGLRADFLEESEEVKQSEWFQRYLEGETVEFYIEGSGGYAISNIDLISHEIYFTKQDVMAQVEPTIYLCHQTEFPESSEALREALQKQIERLNERSRLVLSLEESVRSPESPVRLSNSKMRKLKKSLLFIADVSAIASIDSEPRQLIPSPTVCVEVGYALQSKRTEQILLVAQDRPTLKGEYLFDLPRHQQLSFKTVEELQNILPAAIEAQLQRFNLFS